MGFVPARADWGEMSLRLKTGVMVKTMEFWQGFVFLLPIWSFLQRNTHAAVINYSVLSPHKSLCRCLTRTYVPDDVLAQASG